MKYLKGIVYGVEILRIFGICWLLIGRLTATKKFRAACDGLAGLYPEVVQSLYMDNECYFHTSNALKMKVDAAMTACTAYVHPVLGQARLLVPRYPTDISRICQGMGKSDTVVYFAGLIQPAAHRAEVSSNFKAHIKGQMFAYPSVKAWGVTPYYGTEPTNSNSQQDVLVFRCSAQLYHDTYRYTASYNYFCQFDDPQPAWSLNLVAKNAWAPSIMRFEWYENYNLGDCSEACLRQPTCVSVAFNKQTRFCYLQWTHYNHTVQVPEPADGFWWYQRN